MFDRFFDHPAVYNFIQKSVGGNLLPLTLEKGIKECTSTISYHSVLDAGCGTGLYKKLFKGNYLGVDINEQYLSKAKQLGENSFRYGDATNLPFRAEKFDLIFTFGVLHHLPPKQQQKMISEMWRVCETGGHILITDGLIPANKLNVPGFILAKLDRGRFKTRFALFKQMIETTLPKSAEVSYRVYRLPLFDVCFALVQKIENKKSPQKRTH